MRDYNGIDGYASVRGSLCRVDAHEEWGRRNAPSGRCSHAPANDVAASTGLQHSIDRRPADLESLGNVGSAHTLGPEFADTSQLENGCSASTIDMAFQAPLLSLRLESAGRKPFGACR